MGRRHLWLLFAVALVVGLAAPGPAAAAGRKPSRARSAAGRVRPPMRSRRPARPAHRAPARSAAGDGRWIRDGRLLADRAVGDVETRGLAGDEALDAAVEHLMDLARLRGIDVSLSVGNLRGAHRTITSRYAFVPFDPASTTMLVTAAHALDRLGPRHRFRTPFRTDAGGNLYVEGAFDPTLDDAALRGAARAIRRSGVTELAGDLVIDLHRLDGDGTVDGHEVLGAGAAERLRTALHAEGVTWKGGVRQGPAPRGARLRHTHVSPPLAEIVRSTLARSRSFDAELLALAAASEARGGKPVAATDGAADLGRFLFDRVGLDRFEREFKLTNASGRGSVNQLTSDNVLEVLRFAAGQRRTRPLLAALSSPDRLRGTAAAGRLRAKAASAGNAQSLSGVVEGIGGRDGVAFSALATGPSAADTAAWLDALAITLSRIEPKAPRPGPVDRASWPAVPDGLLELETTFGRPGEHLVTHPLRLGPGGSMIQVRLNRRLIAVMEAVLADADDKGLLQHIKEFGGSYVLRTQRRPDGTELTPRRFSTHSYGVSFDFNPDAQGGDVHPDLGAHFESYGFRWGKYFANNYDPMHFQFVTGY